MQNTHQLRHDRQVQRGAAGGFRRHALLLGCAKKYGLSDPLFAVCLVLALIVMYDAMGVRLETGRQAKILNLIMDDLREEGQDLSGGKKLKELVGHTPLQVLSGALLGVLIAVLIPVF